MRWEKRTPFKNVKKRKAKLRRHGLSVTKGPAMTETDLRAALPTPLNGANASAIWEAPAHWIQAEKNAARRAGRTDFYTKKKQEANGK